MINKIIKIPLLLTPQPEGGYTITSPLMPELATEGDTPDEVMANVNDAIQAVLEIYEDLGKPIPPQILQDSAEQSISFEYLTVA